MGWDGSITRPVVIGANHRSSALAVRDALFVDDQTQAAFLAELRDAGMEQALAVSTCDRVEVWTLHHDPAYVEAAVTNILARRGEITSQALQGQLYRLADDAALRHLFAVTASLDSLIIGEPHVLGQVKACQRMARDAGMCGAEMETVLAAAYTTAKRVRSETVVAERPVSIASAAVQFAQDLHGDLKDCEGLLLGVGDMGELVAEAMLAAGLKRLVVAAPRLSRAETLAESLNCHVAPFDDLAPLLADADLVLTAVSGRHTVIAPEQVQLALKKRRRKPVFLVDTGIPGDIDPAVNRVDGAYLYDLTDLERVAMEGRASREQAAREAWAIVDAELASFTKGRAARAAVPAIISLRGRFETMREQVLTECGSDADKATRLLINRLLHEPTEAMKDMAASRDAGKAEWDAMERLLKRLFKLDETDNHG